MTHGLLGLGSTKLPRPLPLSSLQVSLGAVTHFIAFQYTLFLLKLEVSLACNQKPSHREIITHEETEIQLT